MFASLTGSITLTPMIADLYIVTIELVVAGDLAIDGSDARAGVSLNVAPQGKLSTNDFRSYTTTQSIVADTLSAQYQLQGETTIDITTQLFFLVRSLAPGATATGDFRNTAILNLTITALNGAPLSLEEVGGSSASGNFATMPLPGSLPLASAALGGLLWRARRRRPARAIAGSSRTARFELPANVRKLAKPDVLRTQACGRGQPRLRGCDPGENGKFAISSWFCATAPVLLVNGARAKSMA